MSTKLEPVGKVIACGEKVFVVEIETGCSLHNGERLFKSADGVSIVEKAVPMSVEQVRNAWNSASNHSSVVTEKALRSFYWRLTGMDAT